MSRRHSQECALQRSAQSDDLRKRARQFLRGSIQFGALAQSLDGRNCQALRDIQTHEPVRSAGVITTREDEYRSLLRYSSKRLYALLRCCSVTFGLIVPWRSLFIATTSTDSRFSDRSLTRRQKYRIGRLWC